MLVLPKFVFIIHSGSILFSHSLLYYPVGVLKTISMSQSAGTEQALAVAAQGAR